MKFLLDHDVPDDVAFTLESLGHEVTRLREALAVDSRDDEVLAYAGAGETGIKGNINFA